MLSNFITRTIGNMLSALGTIVFGGIAAVFLSGLIAVIWLRIHPLSLPGENIAASARGHVLGTVRAVRIENDRLVLDLDVGQGRATSAALSEVRLVPARDPYLRSWQEKTREFVDRRWVGSQVEAFAPVAFHADGRATPAHLVDRENIWMNGWLTNEGFVYAAEPETPLPRVAVIDLYKMEEEARIHRRGCWNWVSPRDYRSFPGRLLQL